MTGIAIAPGVAALPRPAPVTLGQAFWVWLRIAALSFGGPAGQIAVMHRILVEEKRWIGEQRFLHALNYCMLLPGPEAQQLATYIGWLLHKTKGGIVAGTLFVLPGMLSIMALSWVYVLYGKLGFVAALFFGLKAAVLAVVVQAVLRIGGRALRSGASRLLAATAFVLIFFLGVPFPLIILAAGLIGWWAGRNGSTAFKAGSHGGPKGGLVVADADTLLGEELPAHAHASWRETFRTVLTCLVLWLVPVLALLLLLGPSNVFTSIAIFFSKMAVATFGGAYAVLAYVAQQAVDEYHWLSPGEMLDGLGMAETTPGPLIMVLQFVGFLGAYRAPGMLSPLLAGTLGGLLATWVTFLPCFLWIFLGAPYIERLRGNAAVSGALSAITAAVVGVVLNLALWFAIHTLFRRTAEIAIGPVGFDAPVPASLDPWALALSLGAMLAIFLLRSGVIVTLAATAGLGVVLHVAGLIG
ncbi:chromate efflux transporter [Sphingomonas kyeonggiensis]|uniref:Chromate transporter n=1 Tax=Sphingomonas kyeonggiensis TaxID=1268553 RepID=A0A7W6NWE2_9SPHN|nr:chromate efflux transporter [Sphingomonas kyeonggiensis]MBB4097404.1 chromate transporter [Sphingomonas kyeonggiensis]